MSFHISVSGALGGFNKKTVLASIMLGVLAASGCTSSVNSQAQVQTNAQTSNVGLMVDEQSRLDNNTDAGVSYEATRDSALGISDTSLQASSSNTTTAVYDPFEPVNRLVWDFNYEILDRFLVKPITKGYVAVTPQPIRTGLLNASDNIEEPVNAINNLLQGKGQDSVASIARFAINSTVGLFGFFDVAESMGLVRKEEDFGEVLGVWGAGTGPYLMLPALGPSDIRSFTGRVVDGYVWPKTIIRDPFLIAALGISVVETRASLLEQEETLKRSLDQYLFVRDAYFQRLAFKVSDGAIIQKSEEELEQEQDDFSDFEDLLNGT